ncbi:Nicastrin [Arachis hypogaea]|nr:Nicastrin [Arachis hypogaea]
MMMMNMRLGELLCSSVPILGWLMDSIAELFAATSGKKNLLNTLEADEGDVPTAANVAAQKHFRQKLIRQEATPSCTCTCTCTRTRTRTRTLLGFSVLHGASLSPSLLLPPLLLLRISSSPLLLRYSPIPFLLRESSAMESVPDLQNTMYKVIDGDPCVRLLNLSGPIGCASQCFPYNFSCIFQLSSPLLPKLLWQISDDLSLQVKLLVYWSNQELMILSGSKFPQAQFAPYHNFSYEWNPIGSGIMWKYYNFPVFLLTESATATIEEFVIRNENKKRAYTSNVAEFDLVMQTTKSGTHDSKSCLKEATCLPLGGYSVWSSLPPINVSSSKQSKPIILAVASMDSASFFRDKSLGADSPISGLIALLAAVDALSHVHGLGDLSKQEILVELEINSDAVHGLTHSSIETVVELGSVGKGYNEGVKNFFAHKEGGSAATDMTMTALKRAQESLLSENIKVASASASNPGIPPSSLMTFSKENSAISGVVLEDFDSVFVNKFYHSHLDDLSNVNSSAVVAAASLVARTLYILASDSKDVEDSVLASINVNVSLVKQLMGCLLACDPGLSCELVNKYISPTSTCPSHYVGVIVDEPSSTPYPGYINDVPRFVWNFLADITSIPREHINSSGCQQGCIRDEVCIKAETDGKGVCILSTTRYVPAYSTRLKYESGVWNVLPSNSSDIMGLWILSGQKATGIR